MEKIGKEGITVSEFIDLVNQTYEIAYPSINIIGELANFRVSRNKWLYFDLKDEYSTLKFFGSVYMLKNPLEDGMMLKVSCYPRMHNNYGFSMQVQSIEAVGEGSLKRAAELLQIKLTKLGIFDIDKKRLLTYPPEKIALITSGQSAAYHDFVKIINNRWQGIEIDLIDVQVQGEIAEKQIVEAIKNFNKNHQNYDVLVMIRGGGSPEDLATFNTESVTLAVAESYIPTLVAIGHEIDVSLAELAADRRASTPSNAAELLVPDKRVVKMNLIAQQKFLDKRLQESVKELTVDLQVKKAELQNLVDSNIQNMVTQLHYQQQLVEAYNPKLVLERGYSIVRRKSRVIRSSSDLSIDDLIEIELANGKLKAGVKDIEK
jgi:exodeoxyribonuclease VII large subunit